PDVQYYYLAPSGHCATRVSMLGGILTNIQREAWLGRSHESATVAVRAGRPDMRFRAVLGSANYFPSDSGCRARHTAGGYREPRTAPGAHASAGAPRVRPRPRP